MYRTHSFWRRFCTSSSVPEVEPIINFDPRNRPKPRLDPDFKASLLRDVEASGGQPRGHLRDRSIRVPHKIDSSINKVLRSKHDDYRINESVQRYLAAGIKLRNFLHSRHAPTEVSEFKARVEATKVNLARSEYGLEEELNDVEADLLKEKIQKESEGIVRRKTGRWKPVEWDREAAYGYLLGKASFDYACVVKVSVLKI